MDSSDLEGTGNALDNALTGNSGANRLDGGAADFEVTLVGVAQVAAHDLLLSANPMAEA